MGKFQFCFNTFKQLLEKMSVNTHETHKSIELYLYNDCHKINPSGPFGNLIFCFTSS